MKNSLILFYMLLGTPCIAALSNNWSAGIGIFWGFLGWILLGIQINKHGLKQ